MEPIELLCWMLRGSWLKVKFFWMKLPALLMVDALSWGDTSDFFIGVQRENYKGFWREFGEEW